MTYLMFKYDLFNVFQNTKYDLFNVINDKLLHKS